MTEADLKIIRTHAEVYRSAQTRHPACTAMDIANTRTLRAYGISMTRLKELKAAYAKLKPDNE